MANEYIAIEMNVATGEVVKREFSKDELIELEIVNKLIADEQAAKEAAREATIAKLATLGLTPEDLAAL